MATIFTGNQVTLEIDGTPWTAQTVSAVVSGTTNRERYDTIDGPVFKTLTQEYQLDVNMILDYGNNGGLAQALTTAALTAPDTSLAMEVTIAGDDTTTVTGDVFPTVVSPTGTGNELSTVTFTLTGDRGTPLSIVTA